MKTTRTLILALACSATVLALTGCGRDEPEAVAEVTPEARALLAHVPADTPYLAGSLAPMPDDVIDAQFRRYAPVTAEAQAVLDELKSELATQTTTHDAADRLALALLSELDGKLSRSGLESLGADMASNFVVYGMGAFPVARVGLSDAATLRATIERVLANAGIDTEQSELDGVRYWRAELGEAEEMPVALYAAVLPTHLAIGIFPGTAETEFLPYLLGLQLPAESDAAERLAATNARHGLTPYGTFTLDLHRLANEFIDMDSVTVKALGATGAAELSGMNEACAEEIHRIIDKAPRLTAGLSEVTTNVSGYRVVLEMPTELGEKLRALAPGIPAIGDAADRVAEFAFGIRVGAARDFVRGEAQQIVDNPFQCEQLAELNAQAARLLTQIDQPLPPFINNFRGFNFSLKTLDMMPGEMIPADIRGHLAVQVENPQMFVGMAQMFLPDLSEVQMAPGDEPVRVPEYLGSFQNIVAYAALSDDAIGVSLGEGEQKELAAYLDRRAGPEGVLLAAEYDMAAWYRFQRRDLARSIDQDDSANPLLDLAQVANDTAEAVSDRNRVNLKFTAQGLVLDSRYTYR